MLFPNRAAFGIRERRDVRVHACARLVVKDAFEDAMSLFETDAEFEPADDLNPPVRRIVKAWGIGTEPVFKPEGQEDVL
jgi:hypothetical protein